MTLPSLPENFDELDETERTEAEEVYLRRLVHYHYVTDTEECNELHHAALTDPMCVLRGRLFHHASNPWEGETRAEGCVNTSNGEVGDAYGGRCAVSSRVRC